ncbi:probable G-protein coupled receptor 139 [Scyliorhinus canicula]|uniref:probable G-protein coupled receptor 139 n=1 Tax=Scyliorhinus canicula TaxID=7830 RepID=UPI0018F65B05|nr:probable G-protein coupled receptor 139 [Scyliorhinus canicula]
MYQNLRTTNQNFTEVNQNLETINWNVSTMDRNVYWSVLSFAQVWSPISSTIRRVLTIIQKGYYPILAIIGVPVNVITIVILTRKNCGLSKSVTCYLVAMAVGDLLVVILDLILRHIPIVFEAQFYFLSSVPVCNIHAVLLYAATDCSVWFTVTFTFDRFVAICWVNQKSNYCSKKTATVVLGTVTVLSCLKNIFWYFMYTGRYSLSNEPWFCDVTIYVQISLVWSIIELIHYILNPSVPFVMVLLLNVLTVRHIVVSSRARRRLRAHNSGKSPRDTEIESRKKSIILLFIISANFVLLWLMFTVYSLWNRMRFLKTNYVYLDLNVSELGFMLQLLSCCTNTAIYAVTQTQFRQQLTNVLKFPFTPIMQLIKS